MVVCTGDARQLRVNISMHSRSLPARAPVRNSLNLALPSGTRTCSQFTEYEYLPPPPPKKNSHRIYPIHVGHLFWFQNGEFRRKVRDFHACKISVKSKSIDGGVSTSGIAESWFSTWLA